MQNLLKTVALGGAIKISTEVGEPVATFSGDEAGRMAYEIFKSAIPQGRQFNLYDGDTGEFLAGDLSV